MNRKNHLKTIEKWKRIVEIADEDLPDDTTGVMYGIRPYNWDDIYELLFALESGWRKKWPAEIYAIETNGGKQAIREAFMIGKIKRM